MNKIIDITINSTLFHIEENAFSNLDKYHTSIKNHFSSYEEKEEILADIEARIAEQFSEKLTRSKKFITISDVQEVIETIGKVEDFEDYQKHKANSDPMNTGVTPKRLYRNHNAAILGGVTTGLSDYFSVDVIFIRIAFVIASLISGIGILVYIILWIVTPENPNISRNTTSEFREKNRKAIKLLIVLLIIGLLCLLAPFFFLFISYSSITTYL